MKNHKYKMSVVFFSFKALIFLVVNTLVAYSCGNTKKQAVEFNNKIVDSQSVIVKKMLDLSSDEATNDTSIMEQKRLELISTIDQSIQVVKNIKPFRYGEEFQNAALQLFNFYKQVANNEYREIIEILKKENINADDQERLKAINDKISKEEKVLDEKFMNKQREFATKYGFSLVDNELQEKINKK